MDAISINIIIQPRFLITENTFKSNKLRHCDSIDRPQCLRAWQLIRITKP